jgi:carboxypeptidase C (cathepsin A)
MSDFTDGLNWYDLYRHVYPPDNRDRKFGVSIVDGVAKHYKKGMTMKEYTPWAKHIQNSKSADAVMNDYLSDYVNNASMREALHIPSFAPSWEQCSSKIDYHLQREGSLWIYKVLKGSGIRMLFYSGDTDGAVPLAGTRKWLKSLNWPIIEKWRPWWTEGQTSGFVVRYDGIDFVTVKGVGHMAPQWARQPVTEMISNWIAGNPI